MYNMETAGPGLDATNAASIILAKRGFSYSKKYIYVDNQIIIQSSYGTKVRCP